MAPILGIVGVLYVVMQDVTARAPKFQKVIDVNLKGVYLFLASEEASFITGTVISVDGGMVT